MNSPIGFLALLFAAGLVCSLVLTGFIRAPARRVGLVDKPDGRRKIHERVVPVAGGIAVFASAVLVMVSAALVPGPVSDALGANTDGLIWLLVGAAMICLVGVVDDARGLRGRYKLLGQIAAVAVVIITGPQIRFVTLFS